MTARAARAAVASSVAGITTVAGAAVLPPGLAVGCSVALALAVVHPLVMARARVARHAPIA